MESVIESEVLEVEATEVQTNFCDVDEKGKVILNDSLYLDFLENSGFYTVRRNNQIELVRIQGNIVTRIIPADVKQFVKKFLEENGTQKEKNYLLRNRKFFTLNYLNALKEVQLEVLRDRKDKAFFFYRNGVVEVSKNGISIPVPYDQFNHLIWAHHIIDREYKNLEGNSEMSVFAQFVFKLANNNFSRYYYICSLIGYALHSYRNSANTRAIIFNDECINDQPEGGSGKSLLAKGLGHVRTQVIKDGKIFNPRKPFEWSDVDESTHLVLIDETSHNFSFEDLFSVITDGIIVEKKYSNKDRLPIEKSPLIIITTNNIIKGYSGSYMRRQYNVDIHQHFNSRHTPIDEFGHMFFLDWDAEEWNKFDSFMMSCVKYYLEEGVVVPPESKNRIKDAIRATDEDFYYWFDEVKESFQNFTGTKYALEKFKEDTGQKNLKLSSKKFLGYIKKCCDILGYNFQIHRTPVERGFLLGLK